MAFMKAVLFAACSFFVLADNSSKTLSKICYALRLLSNDCLYSSKRLTKTNFNKKEQ